MTQTRYASEIRLVALAMTLLWLAFPWLVPAGQEARWWGQFTVSFLFFTGISQFGIIFVSILRLCNAKWSQPFYRTAETITLAGAPLTVIGFLLIYGFGRQHLFFWLNAQPGEHHSPWQTETFLLWRHLLAQAFFYTLAWRAIAIARRDGEEAGKNALYHLAVWLCASFILANSFVAWDFGMMLYPHWHSTVYPIHFWMNSIFGGTAAVLLLTLWLQGKQEQARVRNFGQMFTAFALLWLYFFWAQFVVTWYGNLPHELGPIRAQMEGAYAPLFWSMFIGIFALPFACLLSAAVKRSAFALCGVACSILIAVWLHRYITVMPSLFKEPTLDGVTVLSLLCFAGAFLLPLLVLSKRAGVESA